MKRNYSRDNDVKSPRTCLADERDAESSNEIGVDVGEFMLEMITDLELARRST